MAFQITDYDPINTKLLCHNKIQNDMWYEILKSIRTVTWTTCHSIFHYSKSFVFAIFFSAESKVSKTGH